MKTIRIVFLMTILTVIVLVSWALFLGIIPKSMNQSELSDFKIDLEDQDGYQPEWAKGLSINEVRDRCTGMTIFGDGVNYTVWCYGYVLRIIELEQKGNQYVDFIDVNGYQPEWAKGLSINEVRNMCSNENDGFGLKAVLWCLGYIQEVVDLELNGKL